MTDAAVAVWVKTPGLSPVKTRLARTLGREEAERFYRLSVEAVGAVVRAAVEVGGGVTPYWAVAEPDAPGWSGFACVEQGDGGLGERLARVYDALRARHRTVVFVGADSPQLSPGLLLDAVARGSDGSFVLGPADDGGFYLFAGSRPVPREAWLRVPYSVPGTMERLVEELAPLGRVARLPPLLDVDTAEELPRLRAVMAARDDDLLPEQRSVLRWLESRAG